MATIKVLLRTSKEEGRLRFRLSDGKSVQLFYKSDIIVRADLWDSVKEQINTRRLCPSVYRDEINASVTALRAKILQTYEENKGLIADSKMFQQLVNGVIIDENRDGSIYSLIVDFVNEKEFAKDTKRGYIDNLGGIIKRYEGLCKAKGKPFAFEDVRYLTSKAMEELIEYIKNEHVYIRANPMLYAKNKYLSHGRKGIGTTNFLLCRLNALIKWLKEKRLVPQSLSYDIKFERQALSTPFYLTLEERDKIANLDLSYDKFLENVRDAFILQCYIGCRFSDLIRLTEDNITDGSYIEYVPQKTRGGNCRVVRVPLHPNAQKIIQAHTKLGVFRALKTKCGVTYNYKIKQICKLAGIDRKVIIINPSTRMEEIKPLYEVVSSHTARKTFIGNLYKKVRDPNIIASMSGHVEGSTAFARYRVIDDDIKNDVINLL